MPLTADHVSVILDRLDELFDLEGRLASGPGLLARTVIPGTSPGITDHTVQRRYTLLYDEPEPHTGRMNFRGLPEGADIPLTQSLGEIRVVQCFGRNVRSGVRKIAPIEFAHDSARGVSRLVVDITWSLQVSGD